MAVPLEFKENIKGISLVHFQGEYSQFRDRLNIPYGYSHIMGFPAFRFTQDERLVTQNAASCLLLVTLTQGTWGLYHGGAYFSDSRQEQMSDWQQAFWDFGDQVKLLKGDHAGVGFEFGISLYSTLDKALAIRREATELLLKCNFRREEIKARWNNMYNGLVDLLIDPPNNLIGIRYDQFPAWMTKATQPSRLQLTA